MHKLEEVEEGFFRVDHPAEFRANGCISIDDVASCFSFASDMTFDRIGEHRDHRSGGTHRRRSGEIFADTFQGKMSEYAFYNVFKYRGISITEPNLDRYGLKEWDEYDFRIGPHSIAIKSTKFYGNLLLLEAKDWDEEGEYIPNGEGNGRYDFFVLVRIKPDISAIMKREKLYYSDSADKMALLDALIREDWMANLVGYITHSDLVRAIEDDQIIRKGSVLNSSTTIDADNYYIQAGDFRPMRELIVFLDDLRKSECLPSDGQA